ncbi:hypothetical protein niasHT_023330 [Heterodera trifolii]|uniref:polynucleotide adenylyltransferase n=1 Tax=Heterodera trifolii TaxID=157864 RepID=A0ABD2JDQ8_9BILA
MLLNEDKMQGIKFATKIGRTNTAFGKFRLIIAYLQKWAKVNFILSDELGYFGTKTLTILLIKIFLLYPNGTVPFLVEKFFLTFSAWNWPLPVQLDKIDHKVGGDYLCWTPGREWIEKRQQNFKVSKHEMPMPIITPTFPAQNAAKNVNLSTAKLLKNELRKAFDNIRKSADDGIVLTLEKKKFVEKYEHFIVVLCAADKYGVENFCNFVGKRLRHELLDHVERPLAEWVKLCHLLPNWITVAESVPNSDQNIFKRLWLIGIELNTSPKALSKFKSKIKSILKKKFALKNGAFPCPTPRGSVRPPIVESSVVETVRPSSFVFSYNQPTTAGSINKKTTNLDGRGGAAEKGQLRKICAQNAHTFICQQTLE